MGCMRHYWSFNVQLHKTVRAGKAVELMNINHISAFSAITGKTLSLSLFECMRKKKTAEKEPFSIENIKTWSPKTFTSNKQLL